MATSRYSAGVGLDPASGLGTVNGVRLLAALQGTAPPPVTPPPPPVVPPPVNPPVGLDPAHVRATILAEFHALQNDVNHQFESGRYVEGCVAKRGNELLAKLGLTMTRPAPSELIEQPYDAAQEQREIVERLKARPPYLYDRVSDDASFVVDSSGVMHFPPNSATVAFGERLRDYAAPATAVDVTPGQDVTGYFAEQWQRLIDEAMAAGLTEWGACLDRTKKTALKTAEEWQRRTIMYRGVAGA